MSDERPPPQWERLARYVRARRAELRLTQQDVQARGGPSQAKLRQIESGRPVTISKPIRRRLEQALLWEHGSVDDVLAGQSPRPIVPDPTEDDEATWAFEMAIIRFPPSVPASRRADIMRALEPVAQRIAERMLNEANT